LIGITCPALPGFSRPRFFTGSREPMKLSVDLHGLSRRETALDKANTCFHPAISGVVADCHRPILESTTGRRSAHGGVSQPRLAALALPQRAATVWPANL
jgi:hypothetical protein